MKFIVVLIAVYAAAAQAAPRSAFVVEWSDVAKKYLTANEIKKAEYILNDILWLDNSRTMDSRPYDRVVKTKATGLEQLEKVVKKAAAGDLSSRKILIVLLEISSRPRSLTVAEPPPRLAILDDAPRDYLAKAMLKTSADTKDLVRYFAAKVLDDPDNVALAESVAALAAHPQFAADPQLTDFFLLMSVHPFPRVRIGGLFGLSQASTTDTFVREHLIQAGRIPVHSHYQKESLKSVERVVSRVGNELWTKKYLLLFNGWYSKPLQHRHLDVGDYNMDRIAQAAAAQALIRTVADLSREIEVEYEDNKQERTTERVDAATELPRLEASLDQGGAGLSIYKHLRFHDDEDDDEENLQFLTLQGMNVEPSPANAWILKGLDSSARHEAFAAMLTTGITMNYGDLNSVSSLLKYKILDLPPSQDYVEALESFKKRLRAKYDAWVGESKNSGIRLLNVADLRASLSKLEESNVIPFPVRKTDDEGHDSIFTVGLDAVFAARALATLGEQETATEVLLGLLPERWSTSEKEDRRLGRLLGVYDRFRNRPLKSAHLTDDGKRQALKDLFVSLEMSMPKTKVRSLLIRWIATLKDEALATNAWLVLNQTCEANL